MIEGASLEERIQKDTSKLKGRFPSFVRHYLCSMVSLTGWCTGPSHSAQEWLLENGFAQLMKHRITGLRGIKVIGRAYDVMFEYYELKNFGKV